MLDDYMDGVEQANEEKAEPNYNYTVNLKNGKSEQATGYIIIGHGFYAIGRGKGVLYNIWPDDLIESVTNNGPVGMQFN